MQSKHAAHRWWGGFLSVALLQSGVARGATPVEEPSWKQPTDCRQGSFVELWMDDSLSSLHEEIAEHLRAGLREAKISVCWWQGESQEHESALAQLFLRRTAESDVALSLLVRDRVTVKRVEKELALATLPPSSRSLAIAIHLQELLRASWAETLLARQSTSAKADIDSSSASAPPAPEAVRDFLGPSIARGPRRAAVQFGSSSTLYSTGMSLLGARLDLSRRFGRVFELTLGGEFSWSPSKSTEFGKTRAASQALVLGALVHLTAESPAQPYFSLRWIARRLAFSSTSTDAEVQARDGEAWGAEVAGGLGVRFLVTRSLLVSAEASLLSALAPVWGTVEGVRTTGSAGVGGNAQVSGGIRW